MTSFTAVLFLAHATTAVHVLELERGRTLVSERAVVGSTPWEAPNAVVNAKFETTGRFPSATPWPAGDTDTPYCCLNYNCKATKTLVDCRQYPLPGGLKKETWEAAMKKNFGDKILVSPTTPNPASSENEPGLRAISVLTLKKIYQGAKEMYGKEKTLKVINKQFVPLGSDKPVEDLTMHDINGLIIMPVAATNRLAFSQYYNGNVPMYFVSHNWMGRFSKFLDAVLLHFAERKKKHVSLKEETTYYWVCTMANNQFNIGLDSEVDKGPFATAIRTVKYAKQYGGQGTVIGGDVLAIQDDSNAANLYTLGRIWCVFEFFYAIEHEVEFSLSALGEEGHPILFDSTGVIAALKDDPKKIQSTCLKTKLGKFSFEEIAKTNNAEAVKDIKAYMTSETHKLAFLTAVKKHPQYKLSIGDKPKDPVSVLESIIRSLGAKLVAVGGAACTPQPVITPAGQQDSPRRMRYSLRRAATV